MERPVERREMLPGEPLAALGGPLIAAECEPRAKPRFRIRSAVLAVIATAICLLATASPTLADTGSVYTDANGNVGAGHDFFSGSFSGLQQRRRGLLGDAQSHHRQLQRRQRPKRAPTGRYELAAGTYSLFRNTNDTTTSPPALGLWSATPQAMTTRRSATGPWIPMEPATATSRSGPAQVQT